MAHTIMLQRYRDYEMQVCAINAHILKTFFRFRINSWIFFISFWNGDHIFPVYREKIGNFLVYGMKTRIFQVQIKDFRNFFRVFWFILNTNLFSMMRWSTSKLCSGSRLRRFCSSVHNRTFYTKRGVFRNMFRGAKKVP